MRQVQSHMVAQAGQPTLFLNRIPILDSLVENTISIF